MKEKLIAGLFFIAVFVNFLGPIVDVDFPFHLKTGEYIYQHGEIPKDDPFSFPGKGIVTDKKIFTLSQYWLAQVLFYKLYSIAGPSGIILLRAAVLSLFIFLLWFALRKRGLFSSLLIATLVTIILQPSKLDRPQLFSFLLTLILILLLEKFRENPSSAKPLYLIPPLMFLWSNMHGGFVFGLAVIVIYTISETLKFFLKKIKPNFPIGQTLTEKSVLMLLLAGLLAIAFSYINPNTNGLLIATIESHTSTKWLYSSIREYMSPVEETRFPHGIKIANISFWILFGFICTLIALNIVRTRAINITTFALIFFSSVAALTSMRYIPFFIALAMPLTKDFRFFKEPVFLRHLTKLAISIFLSLFLIFAIGFGLKDYKNMFKFKVHRFYPAGAARFLLDNHIDANMFNSNNKGSYLLWKLYPNYRVFQDTRYISLEATIDGIAIRQALDDYNQPTGLALESALSALVPKDLGKIDISTKAPLNNSKNNKPLWKKLLEQYDINLIVHETTADYNSEIFPLILRLLKDNEWVLIYADGVMLIFVKNDEKYSEIIKRFKKPKELIYDEIILEAALSVKNKITFPTPYSSLAFALMMKGKDEDAKKMIDAALALDKKDMVANFCTAYLALKQKNSKHSAHLVKEALHVTK
ncbi:MAG: hypothetical protein ACUVUQ_09640 [Thermodesulfovibrionales bacterium]